MQNEKRQRNKKFSDEKKNNDNTGKLKISNIFFKKKKGGVRK